MIDSNAALSDAKRALLQERLRGRGGAATATPRGRGATGPLSVAQEQLWYFSRLAPDNPVYNEVVAIRRHGEVDLDALRAAFNALVRRHDAWHTTFHAGEGEPRAVVVAAPEHDLPLLDLSALPADDAEREAVRIVAAEARRPYDLEGGPLLRPVLVRIAVDDHRLYVALHHLVFDGGSFSQTILPELIALYDLAAAGADPALPEPPSQYADYAAWEREWVDGPQLAGRLEHWRRRLDGVPRLELPLDRPRPAHQSFGGGTEPMHIGADLAGRLRELSRARGATLFQTMASAFVVLLHRYSGQEDIVFGTVTNLRQRSEHDHVVGYCVTPLVLRVDVSDDPPFTDLVARTRAELADALDHKVPFERLVRELHPRRQSSANPICQAVFVLEPKAEVTDPAWSLDLTVTELDDAIGHAKFDIAVELDERPDGHIAGRLMFNSDVLERESIQRMVEHWNTLLEGIVADPERQLSELALLTDAERQRQLVEWNRTDAALDAGSCLHHLVAAQAARTPDAIALQDSAGTLTYAELDDQAGRLAHHLRVLGVGADVLVGVSMDRCRDLVVALLAVLKSGGAYVPLEPDHPRERLALIVDDARPAVIVTTQSLADRLPVHSAAVVLVDTERELWMRHQPVDDAGSAATDLAYVLYTSGSTGAPKGVMVEHRSIVNQLLWRVESFALTADDRVLQKTPLGFDVSLWELFCPLLCGATVVLLAPDAHIDPRLVAEAVRAERITAMHFVPSMLEQYLSTPGVQGGEGLRLVASSGEPLKPSLARRFFDCFGPGVELRNLYGPTEAAVDVTSWRCASAHADVVPIGRPVANTRVYLLDRGLRPVPVGAHGELCIGGFQVARGYLNRPDLTALSFVDSPFVAGDRLYRTGDIARYRGDGTIEYVGRRDGQVKVRGNRIELGEIESVIAAHPRVRDAAVVPVGENGDTVLVAYVVANGDGAPTSPELRADLRGRLPVAMMPATFVVVDALPLTASGKTDRRALAARDWRRSSSSDAAGPRSRTEELLAGMWARVLRVDAVTLDADFFDLGGHSLLAARLLTEVERETGVVVPLAAVIDGDFTVTGMAAIIERARAAEPPTAAVELQPDGEAPPLFFIHSDESTMFTLRHFMGPLGEDQRVVGLLPERAGRRFDRTGSIEELARPLLATIRTIQPSGPYHLAGFSLGALLAYEVAAQLEDDGEHVAWLGNLDCETPEVARRLVWLRSPRGFLRRLVERGPHRAARKAGRLAWAVLRAPLARLGLLPALVRDDFDAEGATALGTRYQVRGHHAPMELFVSADVVDMTGEPSLGWDAVHRGSITVHPIPGTHTSMLTEPYVGLVADAVSTSLRRAHAGAADRSA